MDISRDQAIPTTSLKELPDGSYRFKSGESITTNEDKFDIDRFNLNFEQYRNKRKITQKEFMDAKLKQLNTPLPTKPIYQYSLGQILIDTKDAMFGLLDDMLQGDFTYEALTRDNRMFYIGIILIIIALIGHIYNVFVFDKI